MCIGLSQGWPNFLGRGPHSEIWTKARATPHNSIFSFFCILIEFLGCNTAINYFSVLFFRRFCSWISLSFHFFWFKVEIGNRPFFEAFKFHCIIHQEALCAKTIQLGDVMEVVVKTVNVIRARGLFHRKFQEFLSELDAEYGDIVYHSAARWLSRGNVLKRFNSLRSEIDQFLKAKNQPLHELSNPLWLADLSFFVYLHDHLNIVNKRLQGKDQLVPDLYMEVKSFCMLLSLYESQLTNCECDRERECGWSRYRLFANQTNVFITELDKKIFPLPSRLKYLWGSLMFFGLSHDEKA